MDQNGSLTGTAGTGDEAAACSRFVFAAEPGMAGTGPAAGVEPGLAGTESGSGAGSEPSVGGTDPVSVAGAEIQLAGASEVPIASDHSIHSPGPSGTGDRDGLTGALVLQNVESLTEAEAGDVLSRLNHLSRWVQAQQARVLSRIHAVYEHESVSPSGVRDAAMVFSVAAEEAATILGVPTGTAMALMSEAGELCTTHTATLAGLEAGRISYGHAQTVLDQSQNIPPVSVRFFEAELLGMAAGQTRTQFRAKAQRLREKYYPETIVKRQATAFDQRTVWVRPEPDGMSWLSALLPAQTAQAIFTQLSLAARGEQAAGDTRTVDQLRTDILADLLGGHDHECGNDCGNGGSPGKGSKGSRGGDGTGAGDRKGKGRGKGRSKGSGLGSGTGGNRSISGTEASSQCEGSSSGTEASGQGEGSGKGSGTGPGEGSSAGKGAGSCRIGHGPRARTEILVMINAETLFGADDQPAELVGYGPISPVTARRMAREAMKWTPAERDPKTEEILRVGKRRKVPDGLKRVLRVRDGTCRFPGCRTNAVISEIDHTKPWAQGGPTDHDNLEHLCRRHHMFKTEGFWKARQPSPGVIEWTSPGGRCYRTEPQLSLSPETCGDDGGQRQPEIIGNADTIRGSTSAPDDRAGPPSADDTDGTDGTDDPDDYGDNPPPF